MKGRRTPETLRASAKAYRKRGTPISMKAAKELEKRANKMEQKSAIGMKG